jgi:hypothetical protein
VFISAAIVILEGLSSVAALLALGVTVGDVKGAVKEQAAE